MSFMVITQHCIIVGKLFVSWVFKWWVVCVCICRDGNFQVARVCLQLAGVISLVQMNVKLTRTSLSWARVSTKTQLSLKSRQISACLLFIIKTHEWKLCITTLEKVMTSRPSIRQTDTLCGGGVNTNMQFERVWLDAVQTCSQTHSETRSSTWPLRRCFVR